MSQAVAICHDTDREIWLEERRAGIGGSDAPAILGQSSFAGPAKIAAIKLGYELGDEDDESELMRWGRLVERPMLAAFTEETGIPAEIDGNLYRQTNPELSFMQATLDGTCEVDGQTGGVECKLAFWSADAWDRGVPAAVNTQVQHGMGTLGYPFFYVLALLGGYKFRWARVDRDEEFISKTLIPAEAEFWRKIQSGEAVAPMGAPDPEYAALKVMFPDVVPGKIARLEGSEWVDKFADWQLAGSVHREGEKRYKALRNDFFAAVGDCEYAELDDGQRLTLRSQTRAAHDVRESTFRVLRAVKR